MKSRKSLHHRRRFPKEIIRHAVWLYYRFCLSYRDVEDLLAERGINVSYATVRRWCIRFGPAYANRLRKRSAPGGDQWFVDEVFVRIGGHLRYLYRAVDQDGQVLDILLQTRRITKAAARFFGRLLKQQGQAPRRLMTDKLKSYRPAHRDVMPGSLHDTSQYANNRAELSHEPTRQRERRMRRFKSIHHAQLFLSVHSTIQNLFAIPRHLLRTKNYRLFRINAFDLFQQVTCPYQIFVRPYSIVISRRAPLAFRDAQMARNPHRHAPICLWVSPRYGARKPGATPASRRAQASPSPTKAERWGSVLLDSALEGLARLACSATRRSRGDRCALASAKFSLLLALEESTLRTPWQNPYVERVIGSIRRECLDHVIVLGEGHLRRILSSYSDHYNRTRTHLSLSRDSPDKRAIQPPEQGIAKEIEHIGGLHHEYVRSAA